MLAKIVEVRSNINWIGIGLVVRSYLRTITDEVISFIYFIIIVIIKFCT